MYNVLAPRLQRVVTVRQKALEVRLCAPPRPARHRQSDSRLRFLLIEANGSINADRRSKPCQIYDKSTQSNTVERRPCCTFLANGRFSKIVTIIAAELTASALSRTVEANFV